jgi:hypothetical protein
MVSLSRVGCQAPLGIMSQATTQVRPIGTMPLPFRVNRTDVLPARPCDVRERHQRSVRQFFTPLTPFRMMSESMMTGLPPAMSASPLSAMTQASITGSQLRM